MAVAESLNLAEYRSMRRGQFPYQRFYPNAEAQEITSALGKGDEETLKALLWRHRDVKAA